MRLLLILSLCFWATLGKAQHYKDFIIDEGYNGRVLLEVLNECEKKYRIDFLCDDEKMKALTITGVSGKQKLISFLSSYLTQHRLIRVGEDVIFILEKDVAESYGWRKENCLVFRHQNLEGKVIDGTTKEPLIGAKVFFTDSKKGEATDNSGIFNFKALPDNAHTLQIEYVGYESTFYLIGFSPYGVEPNILVTLYPVAKELESVTITAERVNENVIGSITGFEQMSIETLKSIPTFLGEVDPIRSIATLPGVSTVGELASGFNVRGGESGQNLILQDGAPIYNPSHLFGFFSSFNPDMVNNVTLYKGGGPANFGSRISSVLDISLKNGDAFRHSISGTMGLVSTRLFVEGPLSRGKSSYVAGGRISYCNWLVNATDNIELENSSAKFNDITTKFFHSFNEKNFISLSVYNSYDDFKLASDSIFSWSTTNVSFKWDHTFNEKINSTLNIYKSSYYSQVQSTDALEPFIYKNSIDNVGGRYDLSYALGEEGRILAGFEAIGSEIEPGKLNPSGDIGNLEFQNMNNQRTLESAMYVQYDVTLSDKWSASGGLRYSKFFRLGPDQIFSFNYSEMQGRYPSIRDTVYHSSNSIIKTFNGFEPRLSLRFLTNEESSIKVSYYRGYQYMHLISNTTSTTPQDYWVTSGPYLKPQIGSQLSFGYFRNFKNNLYEFSLEGFYKNIANSVDYIEGADITLNPYLEAGLSQGKGLAYGAEFFLKKKTGKINGWLAYTYSRSLRKFRASNESLGINEGNYYASSFDQPNNFSLVFNYRLGLKSVFSVNFNYSTGRPITIPVSKFSYDAYLSVLNYSARNDYRIPDYHRLDLSLTIKDKPRKNKRLKSEWIFSIFNVYSRNNAYSIFFDQYGKANKLSVLGSMFPSITYSFRF